MKSDFLKSTKFCTDKRKDLPRLQKKRMGKITPKQQRFCQEYIIDLNATQAAIRAGYSKKTANPQAARLLTKVSIQAYISELNAEVTKKLMLSVESVLKDIAEIKRRCMQVEPVLDKEGEPTGEYKFNAQGALKASELEGKYLKMFTEVVETRNYEEIEKRLRMGIERVKKYQEEDKND